MCRLLIVPTGKGSVKFRPEKESPDVQIHAAPEKKDQGFCLEDIQ